MASNFDYQSKFIRSREFLNVGIELSKAKRFRQAAVMYWIAARYHIFGCLEENDIHFSDTPSALFLSLSKLADTESRVAIVYLYTAGVLAEWDDSVAVTEENAVECRRAVESLLERLN